LGNDFPYIKYRTELLPNCHHYRIRVAFPTAFDDGIGRRGIPLGIQEAPRTELPAAGFIDFRNGGNSCSLFFKGVC
jgi:hypothetical protein